MARLTFVHEAIQCTVSGFIGFAAAASPATVCCRGVSMLSAPPRQVMPRTHHAAGPVEHLAASVKHNGRQARRDARLDILVEKLLVGRHGSGEQAMGGGV